MINNDRIIPIQKIDYLSMIGTMLALIGTSYKSLAPTDIEGTFVVPGQYSVGTFLANQPVETLDFSSGITSGTVYFVPAYDFSTITVAGTAATISDSGIGLDDIQPDGITLYKAVLGSGEVTITQITPAVPTT